MDSVDTVVIGSGAGGMACAVALANAGERVLVLEQHYLPGGWCHSFSLEGYHFSPGVHYIGTVQPGGVMAELYRGLGVSADLEFLELNPDGFDHVRLGSFQFDIPAGRDRYRDRLVTRFPREADGIQRYFDSVDEMSRSLMKAAHASSWKDRLQMPWTMRHVLMDGLKPLSRYLDGFTKDPELRSVLSIQAGDHGVAPSRALTALHCAIVNHYFDGGFYPVGGAKAIPRAFIRRLRSKGGEIRLSSRVDRILTQASGSGRRAVGVRLHDGTEIRAKNVVSNADPAMTFQRLLPEAEVPASVKRHLARTKWSVASIGLFFAVDTDPRRFGLDSGNLWYSRTVDLERGYAISMRPDAAALDGMNSLFLTCTTLKDPTRPLPNGHHTLEAFVLISWEPFERWMNSRTDDRPEAYEAFKQHLKARMLALVEEAVPGLTRHVVFSELGTPLTNEFYTAGHRGNMYGTEKTFSQMVLQPWPYKTAIDGLFMCGASTTGHGVAGATMSGVGCAATVLGCSPRRLTREQGPEMRVLDSETLSRQRYSDAGPEPK